MSRRDLTARTTSALSRAESWLRDPRRRWIVVGSGVVLVVVLHAVTGEAQLAWLNAVPALLAGLAGGAAVGLGAAGLAAAGHLAIDVALGADAAEILGALVRTLSLLGLGLVGSVLSRVEEQRDVALFRSATEDAITGLLNVRAFYDALADLRRDGTPYSILLADIAGMGELNERYGHPTGTEALRTLGHVLRRNVKPEDLVARLGSDEIAIALLEADAEGAVTAARRLSQRLAEESLALPDGQSFQVHAYFGISSFPADGDDAVTLLRQADHAVTEAKGQGPDGIGVASSDDRS